MGNQDRIDLLREELREMRASQNTLINMVAGLLTQSTANIATLQMSKAVEDAKLHADRAEAAASGEKKTGS